MADNTFTSFHLKPLVVAEKPKPKPEFNIEDLKKKLAEIQQQKPKEVVKVKKVRKVKRPPKPDGEIPEEEKPVEEPEIEQPVEEPEIEQPIKPVGPKIERDLTPQPAPSKLAEKNVQPVLLPTKPISKSTGTYPYDYQGERRKTTMTHNEDPLVRWIMNGRDDDVDMVEEMVKLPSWRKTTIQTKNESNISQPKMLISNATKNEQMNILTDNKKQKNYSSEDPLVKWILNGRDDDVDKVEEIVKLPRRRQKMPLDAAMIERAKETQPISKSAADLTQLIQPNTKKISRKPEIRRKSLEPAIRYDDEDLQFHQWIMNGATDYKKSSNLLKLPNINQTST